MRRAKVGILLVLAVLVAAGLYVRWRAGEAGKVRRVVESMRRAGEAKNEARFMSYISPSYHDRLGMTYERVAKVVEILARGPENYRVKVSGFRVSVKPKSAVASMNVSVTMDKEKPASARLIAGPAAATRNSSPGVSASSFSCDTPPKTNSVMPLTGMPV